MTKKNIVLLVLTWGVGCQDAGAWSWANVKQAFKEVAEETGKKVGLKTPSLIDNPVQQAVRAGESVWGVKNANQIKEIKEAIYGGAAGIAVGGVIGGGIGAAKKAHDKKKEEKEKKQAQAKQDAALTALIQHLEKQQGGKQQPAMSQSAQPAAQPATGALWRRHLGA